MKFHTQLVKLSTAQRCFRPSNNGNGGFVCGPSSRPQKSKIKKTHCKIVKVVKFLRRDIRGRVHKARKHLQNKSTKDLDPARYSENRIYIMENLTQMNKDLKF